MESVSFSSLRSHGVCALRWLGVGLLSLALFGCGSGGGDEDGDEIPTVTRTLPFTETGLSGVEDSVRGFEVTIPAGTTSITVTTSGGSGDADLYVAPPGSTEEEDAICVSDNYGNSESCVVDSDDFPASGKLLIVVYGWDDYSGLSLSVTSTSGGGGGGGGDSSTSLAGTWAVTETITGCGGSDSDSYSVTIAQSGSSLTVTAPAGTFTGTLSSSSSFSWSGSYPEDGGTVTTSITGTITGSNSITGTSSWTWAGDGESCSGTTSFTATRN